MIILLYLCPPVIAFLYKTLDYFNLIDKITGRTYRISGLKRLQSTSGYPINWIYDDEIDKKEFDALIKMISGRTESEKLVPVLEAGNNPSVLVTAGEPNKILGLDPKMGIEDITYFSGNHPVFYMFGVNRTGGNGKCVKACTLNQLEKWIDEEKKEREYWVGIVVVSLMTTALIMGRLLVEG